ncbi:MAG: sigma-70 family RNA polymerase sigma factor [Chitinophagaceae bacterium]
MKNLLNKPVYSLVLPASIKNGDHTAFLTVYNTLHIKVFRFFLKKVHAGDLAKELTQQTFIRLWQFRHTLSDAHPLEKQLFIIAHSLLVNHFEKESNQKKLKLHHVQEEGLNIFSHDQHASFELSDRINTAIEMLPPVRKKILILKAFHDYSNKEIAQQMEISVKTVEDHVTRAFRRMKQLMLLLLMLVYILLSGSNQP